MMLTTDEITCGSSICDVLEPLLVMTEELSGKTYVTSSLIRMALHRLQTIDLASGENDCLLVMDMRSSLMEYINKVYLQRDTIMILNICCFLDPRFKEFKFSSIDERLDTIKFVTSEAVNEIRLALPINNVAPDDLVAGSSANTCKKSKVELLFATFFTNETKYSKVVTAEQLAENEISSYISEPSAPMHLDSLQ